MPSAWARKSAYGCIPPLDDGQPCAARWTHLKDSDPGEADVIERDGSLERIAQSRLADRVVFVPVDAGIVRPGVVGERKR